jgi:PKD repeat protein
MIVFEDDHSDWIDGLPRNVRMHIWSSPSLAAALAGSWADDCIVALNASATSDPQHLSPSFASDGASVYWGDDAGVEMAQVADRSDDCAHVVPTLVLPGGKQPFVSPAPLPSGTGAGGSGSGSGGGGGGGAGGLPPAAQLPPVAAFRAGTRHVVVGHKVRFTGASSTAGSAPIVKFAWRFGDGGKRTGKVVRHAFHKTGKYRVRLVVTDANGKTSTVKHTVRVRRH